ncbi:MAG TPA: hypothetical protein VF595_12145 [Tepidisphaeraceae bacterium]|jgi:hypothetical protein
MSETISHTWQTVEQAAVTLNVSTRTIARRLANGSLETRVDDNGRRLVLIQQINSVTPVETGETMEEAELALSDMPTGPSSQALTMMTVLQTTITAARDDARSARRTAKWAWAGVGIMSLLLFAGAAIVGSTVTRSVVTTDMLRVQLADTKTDLKQTQAELMATRTAEAQAVRDLTQTRRELDQRRQTMVNAVKAPPPATQPTLLGRVVSLFNE